MTPRPSGFAQMVQCPGSLTLQALYPEREDTPDAMAGTAAHWVLQQMLTTGRDPQVGELADNGVAVTLEMIEAAAECAEDVRHTLAGTSAVPVVEQYIGLPRVLDGCGGTPDVRASLSPRMHYAWDFKFGHRYVPAFENWQLIGYASGFAMDEPGATVVLKIVQPRSFHVDGPVRTWRLQAQDLAPYVQRLHVAAHEAVGRDPQLRTGPACQDCTARHACPALTERAYEAREVSGKTHPLEITGSLLAVELRTLWDARDRLDARISGLEAQAEALLRTQAVPGLRLTHGQGRAAWSRPVEEVKAMADMLGVSVLKPPALITPPQAEAAGMPAELVAAYSHRPSGAAKLVADDGTFARQVFGTN
jgi:Protein of unknown function (DUF2800)